MCVTRSRWACIITAGCRGDTPRPTTPHHPTVSLRITGDAPASGPFCDQRNHSSFLPLPSSQDLKCLLPPLPCPNSTDLSQSGGRNVRTSQLPVPLEVVQLALCSGYSNHRQKPTKREPPRTGFRPSTVTLPLSQNRFTAPQLLHSGNYPRGGAKTVVSLMTIGGRSCPDLIVDSRSRSVGFTQNNWQIMF
jgi:hypothetical protein